MSPKLKLAQVNSDECCLTVYRGVRRYTVHLTNEETQELSNKLQSFAKAQQGLPWYIYKRS